MRIVLLIFIVVVGGVFLSCQNPLTDTYPTDNPNNTSKVLYISPDTITVNELFYVVIVNYNKDFSTLKLLLDNQDSCKILRVAKVDSITTIVASYKYMYHGYIRIISKQDTLISQEKVDIIQQTLPKHESRIISVSIDSTEVFEHFEIVCCNIDSKINNYKISLSDGSPLVIDKIRVQDSLTIFEIYGNVISKGYLQVQYLDTTLISEKLITIYPLIYRGPRIISVSSDSLRPKRKFQIVAANIGYETDLIKLSFTDGVKIYIDSIGKPYSNKKSNQITSIDSLITMFCHFDELSKGKLVLDYQSSHIVYLKTIVTTVLPWDKKNLYFRFENIPYIEEKFEMFRNSGAWDTLTTYTTQEINVTNYLQDKSDIDWDYYTTRIYNRNIDKTILYDEGPNPIDYSSTHLSVTINPDNNTIESIGYRLNSYTDYRTNPQTWQLSTSEHIECKLINDTLYAEVTGTQLQKVLNGYSLYSRRIYDSYDVQFSNRYFLPLKPNSKLIIKIW